MKSLLICLLISVLLNGCSTAKFKKIEQLRLGMDKNEILDELGSPNSSNFKKGKHEWIYVYYKNDIKYAKKLYFKKSRLVKIEKHNLNNPKGSGVGSQLRPLKKREHRELKKALKQKKRIEKYEKGFEKLN